MITSKLSESCHLSVRRTLFLLLASGAFLWGVLSIAATETRPETRPETKLEAKPETNNAIVSIKSAETPDSSEEKRSNSEDESVQNISPQPNQNKQQKKTKKINDLEDSIAKQLKEFPDYLALDPLKLLEKKEECLKLGKELQGNIDTFFSFGRRVGHSKNERLKKISDILVTCENSDRFRIKKDKNINPHFLPLTMIVEKESVAIVAAIWSELSIEQDSPRESTSSDTTPKLRELTFKKFTTAWPLTIESFVGQAPICFFILYQQTAHHICTDKLSIFSQSIHTILNRPDRPGKSLFGTKQPLFLTKEDGFFDYSPDQRELNEIDAETTRQTTD